MLHWPPHSQTAPHGEPMAKGGTCSVTNTLPSVHLFRDSSFCQLSSTTYSTPSMWHVHSPPPPAESHAQPKSPALLWCAEAGPACGLPHCGGFQAAATSCVLVSEFYYLSVAAVLPLQTSWRIMGEFLPACAVFRAHVCWRHQLLAEAA